MDTEFFQQHDMDFPILSLLVIKSLMITGEYRNNREDAYPVCFPAWM